MKIDWAKFWEQDRSDVEWLIEPILARGRGHSFFAKQKTGKSLLTLYLSTILVDLGHVVLYYDYEMSEADIYERLIDMGHGPESDFQRFHYDLLPDLPPLDTQHGARRLIGLVDDVQALYPDRHVIVVLDTMGRAVEGPENDADTVRAFYSHTGLALKQRGVTWARLDHAGKNLEVQSARGSSAKGDDVDVVWEITKLDEGYGLRREASRMSWVPPNVKLRLHDHPLRFEVVAGLDPAGTRELVELLDSHGAARGLSVRETRALLAALNEKATQSVLQAAVRNRKGIVTPLETAVPPANVTPLIPRVAKP